MKTTFRLLSAFILVSVMLMATACQKSKARDELKQGTQDYRNAHYTDAIAHFRKAAELDPQLKDAKLYLATAEAQMFVPGVDTAENVKYGQDAIADYQAVLQLDPRDVNALKGLAYLFLQQKNLDGARAYYQKSIAVDPQDPEAYYSVGVIEWIVAYKDTVDRKAASGLRVEDDITDKGHQRLCEEIKADIQGHIDEGLKFLQAAMEKRQNYDDAMVYVNLLYLRKADTECGNPAAAAADRKLSEDWSDKALAARKTKNDEAAKKVNGGGIVLDQK